MTLDELVDRARWRFTELGLDQLPDARIASEISARTVRFLRQAGVVSRPSGAGPAASWSELHLEQLLTARALQAQGKSIEEAARSMNGLDETQLRRLREELPHATAAPAEQQPAAPCSAWRLTPDFTLVAHSRKGINPEKLRQIQRILTSDSP